jgi:activating signal cointegrator complex subunit 2
MAPGLPAFAPFPAAAWKKHIPHDEWEALLKTWAALARAYLALSDQELVKAAGKDEFLADFLSSFAAELAKDGEASLGTNDSARSLLRSVFLLTTRLLAKPSPPGPLVAWEFLADFSKIYGKARAATFVSAMFQSSPNLLEGSLSTLKKFFIQNLDAGFKGDIKLLEQRLARINHLIHASPDAAAFFLAGADFLDGLVTCYKIMNPPLRKTIITTTYLCIMGLTEGEAPNYSLLTDQLYSLKAAAETHKAGPLNANDSLVAELVTVTPMLKQISRRSEEAGAATGGIKSRITALEGFRKPGGGSIRPMKRLVRRKIDKGKGIALDNEDDEIHATLHIHRMSQITQIQDLFPELGSGFVSKLLDEYEEDSVQVIAHLLEDSLPTHLATADRSEQLYVH